MKSCNVVLSELKVKSQYAWEPAPLHECKQESYLFQWVKHPCSNWAHINVHSIPVLIWPAEFLIVKGWFRKMWWNLSWRKNIEYHGEIVLHSFCISLLSFFSQHAACLHRITILSKWDFKALTDDKQTFPTAVSWIFHPFLFYLNKYTKNTTQQGSNRSLSFKSTIPEAFGKRLDSESGVQILFPLFS